MDWIEVCMESRGEKIIGKKKEKNSITKIDNDFEFEIYMCDMRVGE